MLLNLSAVFIGGGLGAVLRFLISTTTKTYLGLPLFGTLFANLLGCLVMGFMFGLLLIKSDTFPAFLKIFITVGFLGGLTTFSTFSIEIFDLFRCKQFGMGLGYLVVSCVLGLSASALGYFISLKALN